MIKNDGTMKMNQRLINKVKGLVNELGLIGALNIFGGEKEIIRQTYIDNSESYLDYLIGNLNIVKNEYKMTRLVYNYKKNILTYEDDSNEIYVDDFIWNYFYGGIMQFDKTKIEKIFTEWLSKHYPKLSERKPMVYSDYWEIKRKWTNSELLEDIEGLSNINEKTLRGGPDYMVVSNSMTGYLKTINVGK
jgi:hypothetical protein